MTQAELAALADVGPRFVGELERGKPTLEIGKVLRVLDRLALGIGGRTDAGNLPSAAWHDEARVVGVKPKYVIQTVESVTDAIEAALPVAVATIAGELGDDGALVAVRRAIGKGVRSVRRGLATS